MPASRPRPVPLTAEPLEDRTCPSFGYQGGGAANPPLAPYVREIRITGATSTDTDLIVINQVTLGAIRVTHHTGAFMNQGGAWVPQGPVVQIQDQFYNIGGPGGVKLVIDGGAGRDVVVNNTFVRGEVNGGAGDDEIYGGAGNDTISGGADLDKVFAGGGNDTIHGDGASDELVGGDGLDHVYGDGGADTLIGGKDGAADVLYGGADADSFHTEWHYVLGVHKRLDVLGHTDGLDTEYIL